MTVPCCLAKSTTQRENHAPPDARIGQDPSLQISREPPHKTNGHGRPMVAPTKNVGADSISARARLRQGKPPRAHIACAALSWPPLRGGSARRRWGREPCGSPEYFGSWQGSLPPPLRGTSLAEGGQTRAPTDFAFDTAFAGSGRYNKKRACDILYVTGSWCAVQDSNL